MIGFITFEEPDHITAVNVEQIAALDTRSGPHGHSTSIFLTSGQTITVARSAAEIVDAIRRMGGKVG